MGVDRQPNPPMTTEGTQVFSVTARRINEVVSGLLRSGIEPEKITIDVDHKAIIIRESERCIVLRRW